MKIYIAMLLISIFAIGCSDNSQKGTIEESGTIESTDVLLSSQVAGTLQNKYFDEGDEVFAGDTLLVIDPYRYQLQVIQANSQLKAADAKLKLMLKGARKEDIYSSRQAVNNAEINFKKLDKDRQRSQNLLSTNSITQKQFDDVNAYWELAKNQLKIAKQKLKKIKSVFRPEEIQQAEANLENAEAMKNLAEKNLSDCFITSPQDGMIVEFYPEKGESIMPNASLVKVSNLSQMEIVIYVSETDLPNVKLNQNATIKIDAFTDKNYEGKVIFISPVAEFTPKNIQTKDERTKLVFAVKIRVDNPEFELKSGMPADVTLDID